MRSSISRLLSVLFALFLLVYSFGCTKNPIDTVKNGNLELDKSVTVGNAFEGYNFFSSKSWKQFDDAQKRKIVEFNGTMPFDKLIGATVLGSTVTPQMVENTKKALGVADATYVAQFAIGNNGKTFELKYSGTKISVRNQQSGAMEEKETSDDKFNTLQSIYANKFDDGMVGLILLVGSK